METGPRIVRGRGGPHRVAPAGIESASELQAHRSPWTLGKDEAELIRGHSQWHFRLPHPRDGRRTRFPALEPHRGGRAVPPARRSSGPSCPEGEEGAELLLPVRRLARGRRVAESPLLEDLETGVLERFPPLGGGA